MIRTCFIVYVLLGCAVAFVIAEQKRFLRQDVRNYIPYIFTMVFLWPVWLWFLIQEKMQGKTIRVNYVILEFVILAILGLIFVIFTH